jgi:serine/threonine protein kinase
MSMDPGRVRSDRSEPNSARGGHQRLLLADRYRLDAVIGRGGMGQVWRGWDELLGRTVAVKVLPEKVHDEDAVRRFSLEARTAAHLNDPHVVAVYDFGTDQDRLYMVMELVPGQSLAKELESTTALAPSRAAFLGAQIAAGMAAAHRHGVIHRDIKPGNLLLDEQGKVSIADFGIARFTEDTTAALGLTANGQVMGTVAYLSPERALGRPATTASDVYALGCVLYQLLTGTPPFTAELPAAILYQHVHTEPAPPHQLDPAIPSALSLYVLRLLAKDPDERPTADEAEDWLRRWHLDPSPVPAAVTARTTVRAPQSSALASESAAPASSGRPRPKRRRVLVTGTAVAALGVAAAATLALSGPSGGHDKDPAQSHPATAAAPPTSAPATTKSATGTGRTTTTPPPAATTSAPRSTGPATAPAAHVTTAAHPQPPAPGKAQPGKKPKKPKRPKK